MNLCSFLSILASYTRLYLSVCCLSTLSASRTSDCCLATHILLCHSQTPSYNTKIPLSAASSKHFSPCSWCATTLLLNSLASTKGHLIQDLLVHRKFDSLCLTETWQQLGNFSQLKSTTPGFVYICSAPWLRLGRRSRDNSPQEVERSASGSWLFSTTTCGYLSLPSAPLNQLLPPYF